MSDGRSESPAAPIRSMFRSTAAATMRSVLFVRRNYAAATARHSSIRLPIPPTKRVERARAFRPSGNRSGLVCGTERDPAMALHLSRREHAPRRAVAEWIAQRIADEHGTSATLSVACRLTRYSAVRAASAGAVARLGAGSSGRYARRAISINAWELHAKAEHHSAT